MRKPREYHGMTDTSLYAVWRCMLDRCDGKIYASRRRYFDRGISVCLTWRRSFTSFKNWSLCNGYKEGLELDRRDNNGNYCPKNCRWVTRTHNGMNRGKQSNNTSGYKGVSWHKTGWRAKLGKKELGYYKTPEEAARAYDAYAAKVYKKYAVLNFE